MSVDDLIVKATSERNTGEDWGLIISICEKADSSEPAAREAVQALVKRIQHRNVNVVLFALTVSNSLVHNCGKTLRREISSRAFVDALTKQVANKSVHEVVRTRILDFIQQWAEEFKADPSLGFMVDTYNDLKSKGYSFPSPHKPDVVKTQAMLDKEKEDEELQLALALSLSAQESSKSSKRDSRSDRPKTPIPKQTGPKVLFHVRALYDFAGTEEGELRLTRGDVVDVYDATTFQEWWKGEVRGQIGIFPSNYVEKVEGAGMAAAAVAEASRASKDGESEVLANARKIRQFQQTLAGIDPSRDSFAENDVLQQSYSDILHLRPKLLKLLETYRTKQDELVLVNDRFTNACLTYHRLMEASMAQSRAYQPQHIPAPHHHPNSYVAAPPAGYEAAPPAQQPGYYTYHTAPPGAAHYQPGPPQQAPPQQHAPPEQYAEYPPHQQQSGLHAPPGQQQPPIAYQQY
ncbi:uncharacterized protein EV422DRAFT_559143 [Fimicolochytrium jonesii]|uniref:uncharacterized protein n=1 Tax=Fimicolochytrium jonesii TaxID=1396493 RepID=UPI0022FEF0A8|nr:uncharacterized protein EV422DRAFT_559143 [Fimicolochytrium jonesii]KAI8818972.1 hypothetical protein EV422DRAFT_559143 [Fimicolochytrium jonesii]